MLWENLLFEDTCSQVIWIFMMMNHLTLMMMCHDWWQDVLLLLYTGAIDSVSLSVQGFGPWGCRGIGGTPLDSELSQGVGYLGHFIYGDIVLFWWYDMDFMICCWHDLTWWLMMQADDSLLTRLTYGVKGPHTSSREIEGEVWQHPCHSLLALMPWLRL